MRTKSIFKAIQAVSFLLLLSCNPKTENPESKNSVPDPKVIYDSILAQKYGADDYGMKKFVFAFLKRGPQQEADSVKNMEMQMAHLENIQRLAAEGKLVLAGPFFGKGDLRGIYIFNVDNLEEAEELTRSDPAIQAGVLDMELKEWYGSAALVGLNELHKSIQKKGITDEN